MTTNRLIAEVIFAKIRELGYEPYDVKYGNGYFIFDYGEDSVIHFRLKRVWKHWKFGMWVSSEVLDTPKDEWKDRSLVKVFAQYDTQIDKFKPSRSNLCVSFSPHQWNGSDFKEPFWFWELKTMLGMMKKHPFICYSMDEAYFDESYILNFIKAEGFVYLRALQKAIKMIYVPYTKAKIFFAKRNKCVKSIELYNFEKNNPGWRTDYLYKVRIVFAKDSTDEAEIAWLNKWFRKDRYGKHGYFDYVIELDSFRREGISRPYSYDWE